MELEAEIAFTAARQLGLVTWHQLRAAGLSERRIAGWVRTGRLVRVRPKVYGIVGAPDTWERQVLAATLSAGAGVLASHLTASALWGMVDRHAVGVELVHSLKRRVRMDGVVVHRATVIDPRDRATRDRVPVTSFERTLCDCTTAFSPGRLGRVLDEGLRRHHANLDRLRACAERLASGPGRRMSVVDFLLGQRGEGYDPGGSAAERRVLGVLVGAGLPAPVQQHRVTVGAQTYVLDYAYPRRKVFMEYYGLAIHGTASSVAYDSARISDLSSTGWRPLIYTDLTPDAEIVRQARDLLGLVEAA